MELASSVGAALASTPAEDPKELAKKQAEAERRAAAIARSAIDEKVPAICWKKKQKIKKTKTKQKTKKKQKKTTR